LSDDDIIKIKENVPNLRILEYYSIENYLFHPDNLQEYYQTRGVAFNRDHYLEELTTAKNEVKDLTKTSGLCLLG